jgi:hypothetical protein
MACLRAAKRLFKASLEAFVSVARVIIAAAAIALIAPLGACSDGMSGIRSTLGITKEAPDEFGVVSRAPLSLPPDYTLRPPQAGALRPQDATPTEVARQTVFRVAGNTNAPSAAAAPAGADAASPGELALLKQVGAGTADPNIRRIVDQENTRLLEADRSLTDRLIFWQKPEEPGVVVDPEKEAQRLRQNVADGKPAVEGETPIIERKQRGFLSGIF